MERTKLAITILLIIVLTQFPSIVTAEPGFIPWPVGTTPSGQDSSRTLFSSYGTHHIGWSQVPDPFGINFHFGIDIDANTSSTDGCDVVRNVVEGYTCWWGTDTLPTGEVQWVVVVGEDHLGSEGWNFQHLDELNIDFFDPTMLHQIGDFIGIMHPALTHPHLHFMRSEAPYVSSHAALCNPLDYLVPSATSVGDFTWGWDANSDRSFFLPDMDYLDWGNWTSVSEVWLDTLDREDLSGAVDFLYGQSHYGDGMASIPDAGIDADGIDELNPRRILWKIVRQKPGGDEVISMRYVVDFRGELGGTQHDDKYKQFYFRYHYRELYTTEYGTLNCLSNSGDAFPDPGWEGFGVSNIEENCWQTDSDNQFSGVTTNPVLAAFPDGPYSIDVTSYAWDTTVTHGDTLDIELHNFSPVVEEVVISCEGRTIWEAYWTADGLAPEWHNPIDLAVLPDQTLDVTVVFSEPMDTTSVTVTAGVSLPYNDITASDAGLNWSWTNCPEEAQYKDTWHGVFDDLTGCTSGRMTLSIQAQDHDANGLMDPSVPVSDGRYNDIHHSFSVMGVQPGWPVTLHDNVKGSPVLADLDDDGDLDVVIQSTDGWVHILADDGSSWNSHWPMLSGGWGSINVHSCPTIVDLDGDGDLDVLSVHAYGCHARDVITGSNISGWPVEMGGSAALGFYPSMSSPAIGDVDGDGHPEVVICRHLSDTTSLEPTVYLFEHTGGWRTWCRNLEPGLGGSSVICTPAIGDVSSIHSGLEIVVCTAEGFQTDKESSDEKTFNSAVYLLDPSDGSNIWKTSFNCWFYSSPVVGDVDNDGVNEIIIGTSGGTQTNMVLVLDGNTGAVEHTWNVGGWVMGPVALGDLNDDGYLDIAASVNGGTVECWSGLNYQSFSGFPVSVGSTPSRGPSIADIDGDFELEIVVGTADGLLYAINSDGSICSGYPVAFGNGVYGQVAIGNIDADNSLEMILADDSDPVLYCYDLGAGSFPAMMPWRQFQHDSWHTGCFEADNTIPEPPTDLIGEIDYSLVGCEVELEWDLSVNDPFSGSPQEPTDVIWYEIKRVFPRAPFHTIGRVYAGVGSYVDYFSTGMPLVVYAVFASDGTNESEYNYIKFPTSPSDVISLGCSVVEEFSMERASTSIPGRTQVIEMDESSDTERTSVHERIVETIPAVIDEAVLTRGGNSLCLTDGSLEVRYTPSSGADAVVIDLGEECTVTSVLPERISDTSPGIGLLTNEFILNVETALAVEPSLLIEVAGSDREFYTFVAESRSGTDDVRYVRVCGASGLTEVSVYGSRGTDSGVSAVEITRSVENEGWMFSIPVVQYSEEASVKIYDISGRMIWSGHAESGSVLHWDGYTDDRTPVPNGVYLLQCGIGSEVSTGSFVVRRN